MMIQIPGVLSPDDLRRCRAELDRANWQDGRATAGHIAAKAKANQQLGQDDPLSQKLSNFVLERLGGSKLFIAAALPLKVLPPRFNRYADSGTYGDHIDNAVFSVPGTGHRIRGDLSATLFFSEPDEYDGGELVVQGEFEHRRVKLPAGHMILYPASSLHHVTPVTRGARIASFFWIQSMVRENGRRSMLLELDETIRSLGARAPESPEIVRLTGLYHNLLREWAET